MTKDGKRFYLGRFDSLDEAIRARKEGEATYGKPCQGVKKGASRILLDREIAFVHLFSHKSPDIWAIVDVEDVPKIMGHRWTSAKRYATTQKGCYLHRTILGAECEGRVIDHINRNPLDNRKKNLRVCTQSLNMLNMGPKSRNTSGVPGVCRSGNSWAAYISVNRRKIHLGTYKDKDQAIAARMEAERKAWEGMGAA
jgi:hypothetical protein